MKLVQKAIVMFDRCYFIYNPTTKEVRVLPTEVLPNHESTTWFDPSCEEKEETNTIEELMVVFDSLGLVMMEQDVWDFPERPFRLDIPNDDIPKIIKASPLVALKIEALQAFIIERNRTQLIYLAFLDAEDAFLATYLKQRP